MTTTLTKVIIHCIFSFPIAITTFLLGPSQIVKANNRERDNEILLTDLDKNSDIILTDIDDSEGRFFNITYAPYVFLLGALATALLISIPLAVALLMGSNGDDTKGDSGYGSSSSSGHGGDYRFLYNSRKRRSPGIDVEINSKCSI